VGASLNGNLNIAYEDKYWTHTSPMSKYDIDTNPLYGMWNVSVAAFSSRGPTSDGRTKPDILVPGQFVIGARSNGDDTNNNKGFTYMDANNNCPNDCSGHGVCGDDSICRCHEGYCGNDCGVITDHSNDILECCATDCNGGGICNTSLSNFGCQCDFEKLRRGGRYCTVTYAKTSGNKGFNTLMAQTGTSTAAAIAAGMGALIRNYFVKGYYPTGQINTGNSLEPSNALIKAVLVNSARPLTKVTHIYDPQVSPQGIKATLEKTISRHYPSSVSDEDGHGLAALSRVLPLSGKTTRRLYVNQNLYFKTGDLQTYCFEISKSTPFAVTIAWADPPSDINSVSHLVNDLDLKVLIGKNLYFGNGLTTIVDGVLKTLVDHENNVEHVYVPHAKEGDRVKVTINATNVPVNSPQHIALVISGHFLGDDVQYCPECFEGQVEDCHGQNGIGFKNCSSSGQFSQCYLTSCDSGYFNENYTCHIGSNVRTGVSEISLIEGGSFTYDIRLVDLPTSIVDITVYAPHNGARIGVKSISDGGYQASTQLRFTSSNYATPQKISVHVPVDTVVQVKYVAPIVTTVQSTDPNYNTRQVPSIPVSVADLNAPGLFADKLNVVLKEVNEVGIVPLHLNSTPSHPLYLTYSLPSNATPYLAFQTSETNQVKVSSIALELNQANWFTKSVQLLIHLTQHPNITTTFTIKPSLSTSDPNYASLSLPPLYIHIHSENDQKTTSSGSSMILTFSFVIYISLLLSLII